MKIIPAGDAALILKAGEDISLATNTFIRQLYAAIEKLQIHGITEMVPTFNELTIYYDSALIRLNELKQSLQNLEKTAAAVELPKGWLWQIPVLYGGDEGPDLVELAKHVKLDIEYVISLHTAVDYYVFMLGFTPGFCYLGGLDNRIACPRKQTPGLKISAGSVGIAGNQTGIYPIASPGGWQIIGETPIRLFDPLAPNPFLIKSGDKVRFVRVQQNKFLKIKQAVEAGSFMPEKIPLI
jgi:inhibitor of KinA